MDTQGWHLAQLNIARASGPPGSDAMADFYAQVPAINALAEASAGFVWRLVGDGGDEGYGDPCLLVNMSVWESVEALREFAYRSAHRGVFADRARWFVPMEQAHQVLWWIPVGEIPSLRDARRRLELLRAGGPCPEAFTFGRLFPPPPG